MTKKHLRYLFTFLFLTIVGIGGAKADSYTIQFSNKASSATAISSSTNRQTVIGTGYAYVAEKPFTVNNGNVYYGDTKTSIRLGKTGTASSLSIALHDNGKVYATSIVVNCKNMGGTKNSNATLTVNGVGPQTTSSEEETDHTFNINNNIEAITLKGSAAIYVYKITVNYTNGGSSTLSPAGLSYGETTSYTVNLGETFTSPTLTNPNSLTVAYSSSDIGVATVDANTGAVTLVGAGTTTITASSEETSTYAAGSTYYTLKVIDPNAPGTENNPYTVTQARAAIDAGTGTSNVYVTGIVSQVDQFNSNYNSITYWISDDGTSTNQFEVYSGKGINGANFESIDDVQVGDVVVVKGNIKKYNSTYEFDYNNELVSLTRKKTPTLSFSEDAYSVVKNGTLTINATSNSTGAITYQSSNTDVAEIDATTGVVTAKAAGTTTITATIAATEEYKSTTATVELTVTAPKHTATFYQNGTKLSEAEVSEDEAITFPEAEAEINGKSFVGWTSTPIDGTTETLELVKNPVMGTADVSYYAVYATQEGESATTGTLSETEIKANFTASGHKYTDGEVSYNDTEDGINWTASYNADSGRPWIQIKKDASAYLKIDASNDISEVKLTITSASNSSGGIEDITKHTAFEGTIYLESGTSGNPKGALGSSDEITNNIATLIPSSSVSEIYVQTSAAARIWGVEVTCSSTTYSAYCTTVLPPVELAAPIIFHDGGEYEGALKVAMAGQGTIKYTLNGGAEQTYSAPINVSETTTITAWTESNGVKSDEVSKTFTIVAATAGPAVEDNYYTIKNNGNNKYVNVAGRKTVTFVDETATAAGTVIRVKANDKGQVQILRSQGVDIPGYAEKAMNYVPKIVELIVDKLHAEGSGELLGENGLDAIMAKFKESFDYHLYLEEANGGYRIYGRTPSMQPVVDFYAENKANVDAKLPMLEGFINSAIEKVLQKTNGSGASILVPFSLQTVWEKMGSTLTEPVDEASTAKFYEEVLSSEANVWNFAYETAMIYWTKLKNHDKFKENLDKLGDYAKYIDKVENIRPNFKYYIVQKNDQLDFISQGNSELNAAFTTWTLAERTDFSVAFNEDNLLNGKYYTTLYTDFAYTLPESVKAYKVTKVSKVGVAVKEELTTVPAQTPVLLETTSADSQTLTLSTEDGTAPTDNLLKGADYLINEYTIKTAQVESLFDLAKELLGDSYETYMKQYEHLMLRNSGTVNNKYFFGLDQTDLKNVENVRMLNLNDAGEKLGFYSNWTELEANRAFIVDDNDPVKLFLRGDVNRDGEVDINDATATVDIVLRRATPETHSDVYDFEAADANENGAITIDDVVTIVNMVLGK